MPLLTNFPETLSPDKYASLLPEALPGNDDVIKEVPHQRWHELDWVVSDDVSRGLDLPPIDPAAQLYEECPDCVQFRGDVTKSTLTKWYLFRVREIERLSKQVR